MAGLVFLTELERHRDWGVLLLRLVAGGFLVFGVWDNITSVERMLEFVGFLDKFGFPAPEVLAPLSVWVQFTCGLAFIFGLFTRWAGMLCAVNFIIAIAMVDRLSGVRGSFPSAMLVATGVLLALNGAGRLSLDAIFERRPAA